MELSECHPGIAVIHRTGVIGILTGKCQQFEDQQCVQIGLITTTGDNVYAFPYNLEKFQK